MINISKECAKSVGQSIQNPNTFFANYCGNYYGNWVKKNFFYNYWNARLEEPTVDKTIYDPCPPGYTVPKDEVFSELRKDKWDDKKRGWIFKGDIFFPASGHRSSCTLIDVGKFGVYWYVGDDSEILTGRLSFDSININKLYGFRSCGFSIRPCAIE